MKLIRNIAALLLLLLPCTLRADGGVVETKGAFLRQLQPRDSILIADQLRYGFSLPGVQAGTTLALPDYSQEFMDSVEVVSPWQLDTIKVQKGRKGAPSVYDIEGSIVITTFEEGMFYLPRIAVQRTSPDRTKVDTLLFDQMTMEVKTMPVDTSTFEIHDIKGQIKYPVTAAEVLPYIGGVLLVAILVALIVLLVRKLMRKKEGEDTSKDPAYIVALRQLERYRGDKYWAPDKQKFFYSGITDTLRAYMADRFGIDAMEMTTAEIFEALKSDKDITPELYASTKDLFETADFVKFAKHTVGDEDNAKAVPEAVRFVTSTYQAEADAQEAAGAAQTINDNSKEA